MTPEQYYHDHPLIFRKDGAIYMFWAFDDLPPNPFKVKIIVSENDYVNDEDDDTTD